MQIYHGIYVYIMRDTGTSITDAPCILTYIWAILGVNVGKIRTGIPYMEHLGMGH